MEFCWSVRVTCSDGTWDRIGHSGSLFMRRVSSWLPRYLWQCVTRRHCALNMRRLVDCVVYDDSWTTTV